MAYPTNYDRLFDYQGYQNANPTRPLPGVSVNIDLNDIARVTDEIITFLGISLRSDGTLATGSVGSDQLTDEAVADIVADGAGDVIAAAAASAAAAATSAATATTEAGIATTQAGTSTTQAGVATTQAIAAAASAASAAATVLAAGLGIVPPGGRATLTSGTAVTTADVTGATSIYYTPAVHKFISIYSGTAWVSAAFTELTLALDSNSGHTGYQQSGKNFDLFVINDSGTVRLGSGPTWNAGASAGSDTARGTGAGSTELQMLDGVWTNKNAITIRFGSASGNTVSVAANRATYIGSFRTTANGVAEDSKAKRFLWNAFNQAERYMTYQDPAGSWAYSTATPRQANANASNQIDFVFGLAGNFVKLHGQQNCVNSTATIRTTYLGFGLDTTSAFNIGSGLGFVDIGQVDSLRLAPLKAMWTGYPGLGRHFIALIEQGAGSDTQTWYQSPQGGLVGSLWG